MNDIRIDFFITKEQAEWLKNYKERTGSTKSATFRRALANFQEAEDRRLKLLERVEKEVSDSAGN